MNTVNASFARLLEYERRAAAAQGDSRAPAAVGDWSGLAFRLGNQRLVCGMDRVYESLTLPAITRVPGAKHFILGLANVRGELLTVVDLGCFLDGIRSARTGQSRLLASSLRGRPVGLLVDEVYGQRNFAEGDMEEADMDESSPLRALVRRQCHSGSDTWHELDLDTLFNEPQFLDGAAG
ncbi:MAG: chemotaxis protein CheW [Gammaproteobacteria bacterium]